MERFHGMLRAGGADALTPWLADTGDSLLASFGKGIKTDLDAVRAALTEPWSNGQTEGQWRPCKPVGSPLRVWVTLPRVAKAGEMAKLVWRVRLVAELGTEIVSETEVGRIERDDQVTPETLGLALEEGKRLVAAVQAEIVGAQVTVMGERFRWCGHCGKKLSSKGYYAATFRSLFGNVPVRVRRLCACRCEGDAPNNETFSAMTAAGGIAPELAYVTAKFAALVPFAKVANLLSELLPIGGAANAGTVRNRTMRVGTDVAKVAPTAGLTSGAGAVPPAVVIGLDGGYVRSRHWRPERNFEVIAGKVIDADGTQHRFAFARNGASADQFAGALARAGVCRDTPATVLSDGDAGLRNLQAQVLPDATVVLDWFHIAMRFEHVLKTATSVGARIVEIRRNDVERAKWRLWHGRWKGCLIRLAAVHRRTEAERLRDVEGVAALRQHLQDLIAYLEANQSGLVNYGARYRRGNPISTAFVESAINEIISRRMIKKQQMRWTRWSVQPFLDVRVAVLDGTLESSFRKLYSNFRPANDTGLISAAA